MWFWAMKLISSNPAKTTALGDQYEQLCHSIGCYHDNLTFSQKSSVTQFEETHDCILAAPLTGLVSHSDENVVTDNQPPRYQSCIVFHY